MDIIDILLNDIAINEVGSTGFDQSIEEIIALINEKVIKPYDLLCSFEIRCQEALSDVKLKILSALDILVQRCNNYLLEKIAQEEHLAVLVALASEAVAKEKIAQLFLKWTTELTNEEAIQLVLSYYGILIAEDNVSQRQDHTPSTTNGQRAERCFSCQKNFFEHNKIPQLCKDCGKTVCLDCPEHFYEYLLPEQVCKGSQQQLMDEATNSRSNNTRSTKENSPTNPNDATSSRSAKPSSTKPWEVGRPTTKATLPIQKPHDTATPVACKQPYATTQDTTTYHRAITIKPAEHGTTSTTTPVKAPPQQGENSKPTELTKAQLLEEMRKLNDGRNERLKRLVENGDFAKKMQAIEESFVKDSSLAPQNRPISQWSEEDITKWANQVKVNPEAAKDKENEIIAVVDKAVEIFEKHRLRNSQILSILSCLFSDQGSLHQIKTGEGKSTICAVLAVLSILIGEKFVDIATSSPVLAKRDAEKWEKFYGYFGISCGCNAKEEPNYKNGAKECYASNIVYGSMHSFQADFLRHEHKKMTTRGERSFGLIIVDEVDSMLIDECGHVCMIASSLPLSQSMEILFAAMALERDRLVKQVIQQEDKLVYVDGNIETKDSKRFAAKDAKCYQVSSLNAFLRKQLKNHAEDIINGKIEDMINEQKGAKVKLRFPKFLKEYLLAEIDSYVDSCIRAKYLQQNRNYIIVRNSEGDRDIAPVDYANTGVIQADMKWNCGLHQFLQIKHRLRLTAENLCTSFISNLGYIRRYGNKIWGMTGTLGSQAETEMLASPSVYNLQTGLVPSFVLSQLETPTGTVCECGEEWMRTVTLKVENMAKSGRAILVICETIGEAESIYAKAQSQSLDVRLYIRNDGNEHEKVEKEEIGPGTVIVATNLAGRGTDIKVSQKLKDNGGLHVIVAFLPPNLRVEEQAFGRTARQGAPGSAELVINALQHNYGMHAFEDRYLPFEIVKRFRKIREIIQVHESHLLEVTRITIRDYLFETLMKTTRELESDLVANEADPKFFSQGKLAELENKAGMQFAIMNTTCDPIEKSEKN